MTGGPFVRLTHVHDDKGFAIFEPPPNLAHGEHGHAFNGQAGPLPGGHAAIEIAGQIVRADAEKLANGVLVDWSSKLTSKVDVPVKLDGDPQHAGFHFRADNEVNEQSKKETYYLRPDGKGERGDTRNWEPKTKKGPVNLPWDAMSFVLGDKRYTVVYLNHPSNPKESRHSERDYGRMGSYFEYTLTKDKPLQVRYQIWLQDGELTVAQASELSRRFAARAEH